MRGIQSTLFTLLIASSAAYADLTFNLTTGVSPISRDVYELHMTVFWICVAIGILVFGAMFYAMFYHRKSRGAKAASFHRHPVLEITWSIVPVLILILMAIPATKVLFSMNNDSKEDITIKITGYQWKWRYEYLEDNLSFFSTLTTPYDQIHGTAPKDANYLREVDHPLVLPIHKKIRFLVTSNDVNHAWWVPAFAVKRDAISGFINEAWVIIDKPGTYYGQCAELCGMNHAFMPIVVIATTEQAYKDWVAQQKGQVVTTAPIAVSAVKTPDASPAATTTSAPAKAANPVDDLKAAIERGEKTYLGTCAACHQPTGMGMPPTFPALKGSPIVTGPVAAHMNRVLNGKPGTAMMPFRDQFSDQEIADVITYERHSWGNNAGGQVKAADIAAARKLPPQP